MPNVAVVNMAGDKVSEITLNDAVFGIEPNKTVMHSAVVAFLANRRQGTVCTYKIRSFRRRQKALETEGYR